MTSPTAEDPPAKEKLLEEIQTYLTKAQELQDKSKELRKEADEAEDDETTEALKAEADKLDKEGAKMIKMAQRLEAGWLQGGAIGTGIGFGVASGLGVTVGSLVTGVTAIPTTGLGMLVGAGTGLIHGPWIKRPDGSSKDKEDSTGEETKKEEEKNPTSRE